MSRRRARGGRRLWLAAAGAAIAGVGAYLYMRRGPVLAGWFVTSKQRALPRLYGRKFFGDVASAEKYLHGPAPTAVCQEVSKRAAAGETLVYGLGVIVDRTGGPLELAVNTCTEQLGGFAQAAVTPQGGPNALIPVDRATFSGLSTMWTGVLPNLGAGAGAWYDGLAALPG